MATDADIVPHGVTDFVFDLYDSVTLSQLSEEQSRFYNHVFRDLSNKVRNDGVSTHRRLMECWPRYCLVSHCSLIHIHRHKKQS